MKMYYSREDRMYRSLLGRLYKVSQGERSLNKNRLCYFEKICGCPISKMNCNISCYLEN